ncbi:hypothetical protein CLM62_40875 [Streptomyces sp. SA15]|uniref:hypothetical protein n=1 Tax=Streptomyces sp. SA15 TaxID=934019 RepID=UPI000BAE91D5|nr:hypothetical protein [Streptomyces sp. SA15]PAZ10502.1 hypothetical protein CLM62_40875 [Streptomyces sp. SA15]
MKKPSGLASGSIVLFVIGAFQAAIYVTELLEDGDRDIAFLESSCALLVGAWAFAALRLFLTRDSRRSQ